MYIGHSSAKKKSATKDVTEYHELESIIYHQTFYQKKKVSYTMKIPHVHLTLDDKKF